MCINSVDRYRLMSMLDGVPDIQGFHRDVNKLLNEIDQPINENDLSDVDEDELMVGNFQLNRS